MQRMQNKLGAPRLRVSLRARGRVECSVVVSEVGLVSASSHLGCCKGRSLLGPSLSHEYYYTKKERERTLLAPLSRRQHHLPRGQIDDFQQNKR